MEQSRRCWQRIFCPFNPAIRHPHSFRVLRFRALRAMPFSCFPMGSRRFGAACKLNRSPQDSLVLGVITPEAACAQIQKAVDAYKASHH
jgi:hypothetical protein